MAAKPKPVKVDREPSAGEVFPRRRFGLVDETGLVGRELWMAREHNRSREPAAGKPFSAPAPIEGSPRAKQSLTREDCEALLDVLETLVAAVWPSAQDREFMVDRIRATVKHEKVTLKLGGTIERRRLPGHRPLSRKQAKKRMLDEDKKWIPPFDSSIAVDALVDELTRRRPDLVAGVDLAARAELARRWEPEKHEPMPLLAVALEVLLGVDDPVHGVLRKLRPARKRSQAMNENDSLRSWELDRLTSCELDRVRQDEKLYLTEAIVSYDRWRSSAGAPPLTARRLSAFLAAVPGVKKDEEGHHKVIVFLGVALKPRDRQD